MIWLYLAILALAATRITGLLQQDTFGPIADLRNWVLERWPGPETKFYESEVEGDDTFGYTLKVSGRGAFREWDDDNLPVFYVIDSHPVGELWECPRCLGYWVSLLSVLAVLLLPFAVAVAIFVPFAISQLVIWLRKLD